MADVIDTLAIEIAANDSFTAVAKPLLSLLERLESAVNKNTEALDNHGQAAESAAKGTKKLNAEQGKSEKSTKKSTKALQEQEKQIKKNEKVAKNLLQAIGGFTKAIGALGTMILAGVGLDRLVLDTAKANKELAMTSKNLGMSSQSLAAWRGAAELSGGSAQGLTGYLNNLSAGLTRLTVQGDASVTHFFNALGINLLDGSQKAKKLEDIMLELADKFSSMDRVKAFGIAQQMGIDEGTFEMLAQGRQGLEEHLQKTAKIYKSNQQDLETARKLTAATAYLNQQFEGLKLMIANAAMPVLLKIADVTNAFFEYLQKNEDLVKGVFFGIAGALSIALIPTLGKATLAAVRFMLPFLPAILIVGGLAAAIILLYEDYKKWANGGKSLFNWEKFAKWLDKAEKGTLNLKGAVFALLTGYKDLDSLLAAGKAWLKQMGFITDTGVTLKSFIEGIKNVGKAIWDYLIAGLTKVGDLIVAIFSGDWKKAASIGWDLFTHYTPKGFILGQVVGNVTKAADVAVGDDPNDPNSLTSAVKNEKERVIGKDEEPQNQSQQAFAQNTQKQVSMSSGYDAVTDYAIENAQSSEQIANKKTPDSIKIPQNANVASVVSGIANSAIKQAEQVGDKGLPNQETLGYYRGTSTVKGLSPNETAALVNKVISKESGGKLDAINSYGYLGLYQFGAQALADIGLIDRKKYDQAVAKHGKGLSSGSNANLHKAFLEDESNWKLKGGQKEFLANKNVQDEAMIKLLNKNASYLGETYSGDSKHKAGLLMAAHLKGWSNAKKYALTGQDSKDAYGTSVSNYYQEGRRSVANVNGGEVSKESADLKIPTQLPQPSQKQPAKNVVVSDVEHSNLEVFSSKLFERFDKVIDLLAMLRELNLNKPLGGEQMNSIETQSRLQAMKSYAQPQNVYNQRFSEVVINGGVNVNSTASTISGTVADAYSGIHNRVNVMQFNTGFS